MIKSAAIALSLAMAGPSAALGDFPVPSAPDRTIVESAPPEFWDPPDAPFALIFGTPEQVDEVCAGNTPRWLRGYVVLACTRDDRRIVLMPNPCLYQHEYYAKLLCHEQAHLTRRDRPGWKH